LKYTQSYISIVLNNKNSYFFWKRTQPTSIIEFFVKDDEKVEAIKIILDKESVIYTYNNKNKYFNFYIDQEMIKNRQKMLVEIIKIRNKDLNDED
jgi:hypothetical protein